MNRSLPLDDNVKAIQQVTVLECTWTDIPEDVRNDIKKLWKDSDFGNDDYYFNWLEEMGYEKCYMEHYPSLCNYLKENDIKNCLIRF